MVDEEIDKINFKIYNYNANNNLVENTNTRTFIYDNIAYCDSECYLQCQSDTYTKTSNRYLEGDFNGDGISEVIILEYEENKTFRNLEVEDPSGRYPVNCAPVISSYPNLKAKLIDLNTNVSNVLGQPGFLDISNGEIFYKFDSTIGAYILGKLTIADFNGDGKSDVFINYGTNYKILSFRETTSTPFIELEIIGEGTLDSNSLGKVAQLFGDYNGDGKTDLMVPEGDGSANGQSNWFIYFSNPKPSGGAFFDKQIHNIVDYRPSTGNEFDLSNQASFYYAVDTNKDGKTDLVKIWVNYITRKCAINDHDTEWRITTFANNIGNNNSTSKFTLDYDSPINTICFDRCPFQDALCYDYHWNDSPELVTPIVSSYKFDGLNREVLLLRNHTNELTYVNFTKNVSKDLLLKKVTQSNGSIVDEITYLPLEPAEGTNGNGILSDFYSSQNAEQFPNIEVVRLPKSNFVSKLSNTSNGIYRYQTFKYHGYVTQIGQFGTLGFKKTVRSNWISSNANKTSWNVTESDPSFRGAITKNSVYVLDKSINFAFNTIYPDGLVSISENVFTQNLDNVTGKYLLLNTSQKTTDYLTNVIRETINEFSPTYYLPSKTTTNNYLGPQLQGSIINEIIFDNTAPYIGRPADIVKTTNLYVNTIGTLNTKFVNEKLFYTNNNISKKETNSNNSLETLVENFEYFPNGNLKKKTLTAIGTAAALALQPRITEYTYDTSNRYVKTIKDVELLVTTNNTFHPLYGMVLSQTNPYGQTTTSIYDNWGKRTKVTDFLGKNINYTYSKISNVYKTLQVGDDGSESFIESDAMSREIKKGAKDINGNWNYVVSEYDYLGRKYKVSEPFLSSQSPSQWTINEYDDYSRLIKTTAHTGRVGMISYNGLSVTTDDGTLIKTTVKNENNHVVSTTDNPGGTISYFYDANGNLLKSNYDGIELNMTYDNWGRKLSLNDPSAGLYTNTYNAFSEMLTEGTPKGTTTFTYTDTGKILTKRIVGITSAEKTDILSTYSYDTTNKWLNSIVVQNTYDGNSSYTYTYDTTTKQLSKTVEVTPQATFTKELTFDTFGRVSTEAINTTVTSNSKSSNKTFKHTYKNGSQWQILDNSNSQIIWQVNTENQRGQLTSATLGNGIDVTNTYDVYGFPSQIKHDKTGTTPVNIMTLNSSFEQTRGNLLSRNSNLFNITENFEYDNLDRLTKWDNGSTNLLILPFNTTTDGFTFSGTSTIGSVTNSTGKLKVNLKNTFVYAQKTLAFSLSTGNKLRIKADVTNKTGTSGVIVNAVMVETDPLNSSNFIEIPFGTINNGVFDSYYTVSDFVSNPTLKIKFIIDESSPEGSNGGGTVLPNTTFYIDNLSFDKINVIQQNYDDRGRITENNNGKYNYTITDKPYQHASILPMTAEAKTYFQARENLFVTYNAFKSPIQIEEAVNDKISFDYNAMQQRSAMYYGNTNTDKLTRPYRKYFSADGSVEIKYTVATGVTEIITYIGGDAYSAPAIVKSDGTTQNYFYLHRDYLGSIVAITNATGSIVEKRHFDAWGNIEKIQDGVGNNLTKLTFFDRGYTGHEHLQSVNLIHMNGRLYDPKLHRFMQPDNYVQDPFNTQNYNRYSYVLNNPLKHTDPSGEMLIGVAIAIAVAVAVSIYTLDAFYGGKPFNIQGVIKTSAIAAFSSAMTFGFGEMTATVTNFYARATAQAVLHASFNGGMTYIQGGKFWSGFAAGGISSLASSAFTGGENLNSESKPITGSGFKGANFKVFGSQLNQSTVGLLTFGTISGGAGSLIGGGNFWQGAVTGLVVSGLNHAMNHDTQKKLTGTLVLEDKIGFGNDLIIKLEYSYDPSTKIFTITDQKLEYNVNILTIGDDNPAINDTTKEINKSIKQDRRGDSIANVFSITVRRDVSGFGFKFPSEFLNYDLSVTFMQNLNLGYNHQFRIIPRIENVNLVGMLRVGQGPKVSIKL